MSGRPRAHHRHRRSSPPSTGFRLGVLGILALTVVLGAVAVAHFGLVGTADLRPDSNVGTADVSPKGSSYQLQSRGIRF